MDPTRWQDAIDTAHDFTGTKLALFLDGDLLIYRRDDKPTIPYPNAWDLPGGGRENDETPVECGVRELAEEFGLPLRRDRLRWARSYPSVSRPGALAWFVVGEMTQSDVAAIRFGEEGQEWRLAPRADFMTKSDAVPYLKHRLADYIAAERPGLVV